MSIFRLCRITFRNSIPNLHLNSSYELKDLSNDLFWRLGFLLHEVKIRWKLYVCYWMHRGKKLLGMRNVLFSRSNFFFFTGWSLIIRMTWYRNLFFNFILSGTKLTYLQRGKNCVLFLDKCIDFYISNCEGRTLWNWLEFILETAITNR